MNVPSAGDTSSFDYQERAVAYIDVLGFAELVKRSGGDAIARAKVNKLIMANKLFEKFVRKFLSFADGAFFSDSFVLSMKNPESHLIHLIREIGYLCRYLLLQGFPCRGAIATGLLYHQNQFVVGPALVDAYLLEKSVAVYPRIVLDGPTMAYWEHEFRIDECGKKGAHPRLESLVKRDRDGQALIDIFSSEWTPDNFLPWTDFVPSAEVIPPDTEEFLEKAKKRIEEGRAANIGDPKVRAKYDWLATECEEHAAALRHRIKADS